MPLPALRRASASRSSWLPGLACAAAALAPARVARAVEPELEPPSLETRVEAPYPAEALRDHVEGTVGLELEVGEDGSVMAARVVTPAGHGFDEAALAAARRFKLAPAKQRGKPVRSSITLAYEFHLPAAAAPAAAPPAPPAAPAPPLQAGPTQTTVVLARRPTSAASSFAVQDRDFSLRPIATVQDILRVTPGLVMVQHSGGGKASQYFLRGFDADHGTDLALSVDGVPINMPSHAHGQGYSDTNFIIPEAVERVEITKGPYFVQQGDFATAGAVNLVTRDAFEQGSAGLGLSGSPGHGAPGYRGLLVASPRWNVATATFAVEVGRQDGPFEHPEGWDRYKVFGKLTVKLAPSSWLSVGEMSYASTWHGSGQIPARAVEQGLVSRFGSIDPDEGGDTSRHQVYAQYLLRPGDRSEIRALWYLGTYSFDLFSNFTLYLRDPQHGDEIEQQDRRTFYGAKASYRVVHELGGVRFETTIGSDVRGDDIHEKLWDTASRVQLTAVRDDSTRETLIGAYASEEVAPVRWARLVVGLRADQMTFSVDDQLPGSHDPQNPGSGVGGAHQLSPKASAIVAPLDRPQAQLDLYANWGTGFHSNDVRGVFTTPPVTPLARAVGEELGARARLLDRIDLAAAVWMLDLASETTWNGDEGTTAVGPPTNRYGLELEGRYEIFPWLAADGSVSLSHSQFSADRENGGGLALAPKQTWSGGLSGRHPLGPGVGRAGLRFYGIGDRPASDDGVIVAPGFTQVDLHVGYRTRRWDLALDIENLLDGAFRAAQFDTISRLQTEPAVGTPAGKLPVGFSCGTGGRIVDPRGVPLGHAGSTPVFGGCEGIDFTPAYPRTARLMATVFFD